MSEKRIGDLEKLATNAISASAKLIEEYKSHLPVVEKICSAIITTFNNGGIVYSCGNGGSSGDAMHITSELLNRFEDERRALPAVALSLDTMTLTSIANDRDYKQVYSRALSGLLKSNDCLILFTTSGNSQNLLSALEVAHAINSTVICFNGKDGGLLSKKLKPEDCELRIRSDSTARIQEQHLLSIHLICSYIDLWAKKTLSL